MKLKRFLLRLWRNAFPVRYVRITRHAETNIPPGVGDGGEELGIDDMLPELVEAYKTCRPVFAWLSREHARLERKYHERMPTEPAAREVWRAHMEILNGQIAILNRALRVPITASARVEHLAALAEKRKATDAEQKALEEFLSE
jgi:hypothetical protein